MKKICLFIFSIVFIALLLTGCNWDIISNEALNVERDPSAESSTATFTGDAPRNLRVSQAAYSDRITLSFSAVQHADFYRIYRAEVPRDFINSGAYDDSLYWINIEEDLKANNQGSVLYSDYSIANESNTGEKAYLYVVQAGNDYAELFQGVTPKYSKVEKGWLLTPPLDVSADQGVAVDYIKIAWSGVDKVKGYDIQYSYDRIDWQSAYSSIIPPSSSGENSFYFYPAKSDYGKQLYFRVLSSQSNSKSNPSVVRIGYTYVEGAPQAPTGVIASKADYSDKIVIQWDVPIRETQTSGGYTWEITRMATGEEEEVVATFNSLDEKLPEGVTKDNDVYRFEDKDGLTAGLTYEYSIKASCLVKVEGSDETLFPGPAVRVEGYLLSPPSEFTTSVDYVTKDMNISISAPLGFNEDRNWNYKVEGRLNKGSDGSGSWIVVDENVRVSGVVDLVYNFDTVNANEFRFTLVNGEEKSIVSSVVAPDQIKANDFELAPNTPPSDTSLANSNGVYPVVYKATSEQTGITLIIEVDKTGDKVADGIVKVDGAEISSEYNTISDSPDELFEKYSYRARKENPFGRVTDWTQWQEGWGAITNKAFIKMMEKWILKPWEYRSELDQTLQDKWNPDGSGSSNSLADKILNPGMSSTGDITVNGNAGGTLRYFTGGISITNMSADITFVFQSFGERDEIHGTGQYVMKAAKMSGAGKGVEGTLTITSDMYPGVVDFNSLNTNNQKFTGNYLVKQGWSSVYEAVSSN